MIEAKTYTDYTIKVRGQTEIKVERSSHPNHVVLQTYGLAGGSIFFKKEAAEDLIKVLRLLVPQETVPNV